MQLVTLRSIHGEAACGRKTQAAIPSLPAEASLPYEAWPQHQGNEPLGFAARFVTGYLYVPTRDSAVRLGGGSTHAWCQIYVPGSGWIEFDSTNGIVDNRDLIRVAVAPTPQQTIRLFGSYWGDAADELGMEVHVQVKSQSNL